VVGIAGVTVDGRRCAHLTRHPRVLLIGGEWDARAGTGARLRAVVLVVF